ncbi:MAG: GNAT family N-acetyltransferase [Methylophilaceae bacterium]
MQVNNKKFVLLSWVKDIQIIKDIRLEVFIKEQTIPEELEWDQDDERAHHFGIISNEILIAYARVLIKQKIHIGRMAVRKKFRRVGVGSFLLSNIIDHVDGWNHSKKIMLSAQDQAIPFYEKNLFQIRGDKYLDAGIIHYDMELVR